MIEQITKNLQGDQQPSDSKAKEQSSNDESLSEMSLGAIGNSDNKEIEVTRVKSSKSFKGVPSEWYETIQVKYIEKQRVKLYFRCKHADCKSIFKKSCNLRDHFRKHTGQRPFTCELCQKTFTQSGNLGRHLKNVHKVKRDAQEIQAMMMVSAQNSSTLSLKKEA